MTDVYLPDVNIGPAALKSKFKLDNTHLLVRKIFGSPTFQGEMPLGGQPAIFVRLGGCSRGAKDLSCKFCDSDFLIDKSTVMLIHDVIEDIKEKTRGLHSFILVVSGGEPLMQAEALNNMFDLILNSNSPWYTKNIKIQIESNGDFYADINSHVNIVISPKAWNNSLPFKSLNVAMLEDCNYVRFLIESNKNSPYYSVPEIIIQAAKHNGSCFLYLSPITVFHKHTPGNLQQSFSSDLNIEATAANYRRAAKVAKDLNASGIWCGLSCQSHIFFGVE